MPEKPSAPPANPSNRPGADTTLLGPPPPPKPSRPGYAEPPSGYVPSMATIDTICRVVVAVAVVVIALKLA